MDNLKRLVSAEVIADMFDVPRYRIYELTRARKLPAVRIGRTVRFDPDRIAAWIEAGGTADAEAGQAA
jgi:excisionase family DNA binding protein